MNIHIPVTDSIHLTEIRVEDKWAFVNYFRDQSVAATLSGLPDPYTEEAAETWIQINQKKLVDGHTHHYAIRDSTGLLLGCCGFHDWDGVSTIHKSAIGYWIGKPHWGKGTATAVVKAMVSMGFNTFGFERLSAVVFDGNVASIRVLEKAGFKKEGVTRKEFLKNGRFTDGILFGIIKGA